MEWWVTTDRNGLACYVTDDGYVIAVVADIDGRMPDIEGRKWELTYREILTLKRGHALGALFNFAETVDRLSRR